MPTPKPPNPDFQEVIRYLYQLHRLRVGGDDRGDAAGLIRAEMFPAWNRLTPAEKGAASRFEEWLKWCEEGQ